MQKIFDVFGMCNALFDLQAEVSETILSELGVEKGTMRLVSADEQRALVPAVYTHIVNTQAGGSGANTMIGIAQMGGTTSFTSRVGRDEHGPMYKASLEEFGVKPNLGEALAGETGLCLVLITPDAQRTMGTFLGVSQELHPEDINVPDLILSRYLYITGYLWDTDTQKEAVTFAMREAKQVGTKVALSLSDPFCVGRHKADFECLLAEYVDVVFANRDEARMMTGEDDARVAAKRLAEMCGGLAAVTLDKEGSILVQGDDIYEIPIYPVQAIDTTGAGDMYAAGILYGLAKELPLPVTGRIAAWAAGKVVAHLGPRLPSLDVDAIAEIERGGFPHDA
ncbi:adenosine kinase [Armatimonas sp.]|uniref:adenosine kinase n=1 Tax=Armatimonas sp. TaxID=1872638 RepID=UPI003753933F